MDNIILPQFYEIFDGGAEVCFLFNCICEYKGNCKECETLIGYEEYIATHPINWSEEEDYWS